MTLPTQSPGGKILEKNYSDAFLTILSYYSSHSVTVMTVYRLLGEDFCNYQNHNSESLKNTFVVVLHRQKTCFRTLGEHINSWFGWFCHPGRSLNSFIITIWVLPVKRHFGFFGTFFFKPIFLARWFLKTYSFYKWNDTTHTIPWR